MKRKSKPIKRKALKEYIDKHGLTVIAFAQMINTHRQSVYDYLSGDRTPCSTTMKKIISVTDGELNVNSFY